MGYLPIEVVTVTQENVTGSAKPNESFEIGFKVKGSGSRNPRS